MVELSRHTRRFHSDQGARPLAMALRRAHGRAVAPSVIAIGNAGVGEVKKSFAAAAKAAALEDVSPHTLRHTAATWMLQKATPPWQAAGYLGITLETLLRNYGHHHPDYLGDAKRALE